MRSLHYRRKRRIGRSSLSNSMRRVLYTVVHFLYRRMQTLSGRIVVFVSCGVFLTAIILVIVLPGASGGDKLNKSEMETLALPAALAEASSMELQLAITPEPDPTPLADGANAEPDDGSNTEAPLPSPTPDPALYEGVEDSERVTELQNRLVELGYLDLDEPTQHFGPATKNAVKFFQRQHGLEQDGWAGAETLGLIYADTAQKYTLLEGTRGTDVDNFQQQLKDLGYLSKVTGYYGDETVAAVKAFQKENGLSADGKAGEQTFRLINSDKAKASPALAKVKRSKANIDKMIETAKAQLGKKYILGNRGPDSFDCSGLVYYCLNKAGSNRRRLDSAGYSGVSDWEKITSMSNLKRGDLLFFTNNSGSRVGHVGIYLGGGEMIDASSRNGKVVRRSTNTSYWKDHFVCGRRPW